MAAYFGTSKFTDAWLMASVLPNILFSTINGAISTTVVPIMTQGDSDYSPRSVQRFINEAFTAIVLVSLGLIVVGELFATPLVRLIGPGFHGEKLHLTIEMTRIMLPTILFWGLAGLVMGVLQEREEYLFPALSPIAVNAVRISTIVVLGSVLGFGIEGVALGFTFAVLAQLFVTVPAFYKNGFRLRFRWRLKHPLLAQLVKMSGPFFVTSSVGSVGLIVDRILASNLSTGSMSALNFAYVLVQIPVGLVISSLATPIYTRLSQHHSHQDSDTFRALAMKGFRLVILVIVPITIWFMVLSVPLLRLLYQRGAFNIHSTEITSGTLFYFAWGLPGFGLSFYLQRLFFATKNSKAPARYSIITIFVNIIGDIIAVHYMKVDGLALATGLAAVLNTVMLTHKALKPRYNRQLQFNKILSNVGVAGAVMAVAVFALRELLHLNTLSGIIPLSLALLLTVFLSALVYVAVLYALKFPEMLQVSHMIRQRLSTGNVR